MRIGEAQPCNSERLGSLCRRMFYGVLRVGVLALSLALFASAESAASVFDPGNSYLELRIGRIAQGLGISADPNFDNVVVTLTSDAEGVSEILVVGDLFETASLAVQSASFTGFPSLTGLKVDLLAGSGFYRDEFAVPNSVGPGSINGFGGYSSTGGMALILAAGFTFELPLHNIGAGGTTVLSSVLNNSLVIEGAAFGTAPVQITQISSTVVYVPSLDRTGILFSLDLTSDQAMSATPVTTGGNLVMRYTITVNGYNNLMSASQVGRVTMVSPFRLSTGSLAGRVAGAMWLTLAFRAVPEPGPAILLLTGVAGLVVVGRSRMRR